MQSWLRMYKSLKARHYETIIMHIVLETYYVAECYSTYLWSIG